METIYRHLRRSGALKKDRHLWDRRLDRLFDGVHRMNSRLALERGLANRPGFYDTDAVARLLRWGCKKGFVHAEERGDGTFEWSRLKYGVQFVPRFGFSMSVHHFGPLLNGQALDVLIKREQAFRKRKMSQDVKSLIDDVHAMIAKHEASGMTFRLPLGVFHQEGHEITELWQLREALDGFVPHLPLYRVAKITRTILERRISSKIEVNSSPPELDDLHLP